MDITITAISMKDDSMGKNFYCYIFFQRINNQVFNEIQNEIWNKIERVQAL